MNKIKKILCVIDFADGADEAVRQANRFAKNHSAHLTFLAITPSIDRNAVLFPQVHEKLSVEESNLESKILNGLSEHITNLTDRTAEEFRVIAGSGPEDTAAIRIAEEIAADLVVIPDTSLKHAKSWFGSAASRIIRAAHCSVLLTRAEQGGGCVVGATDFSDPAFPAVEAAAIEARHRHLELVLIHSLGQLRISTPIPAEPTSMGMITLEEFGAIRQQAHDRLLQIMKSTGAVGEALVTDGFPADFIVQLAKERRAELVVVGTLGRSGIPRLVLGSTAESVVANAPCSVLIVRLH